MIDLEKSLLGMLLKEPQLFDNVSEILTPSMFLDARCRAVYEKFLALSKGEVPLDLALFLGENSEKFDAVFITNLVADSPVGQNVVRCAELLADRTWRRTTAETLVEISRELRSSGPDTPIEKFKTQISVVAESSAQKMGNYEGIWASELSSKFCDEIDRRVSRVGSGGLRGLATGFSTLNGCFGGWVGGRLYILAARTSIGKTTLAINLTAECLRNNHYAYFFTNEMSELSIFEKMVSSLAKVQGSLMESGKLSEAELDRIHKLVERLHGKPWCINHRAGRYVETFEAECRRLKKQGKLDFVILDYIQQMGTHFVKNFHSRQQILTYVSDRIKKLALDLDVPILALAQINREGEGDDKLPTLANIKDSGSIEQDADAVFILHRSRNESTGEATLCVAKNRHGRTGSWKIKSDLIFNQFTDDGFLNV